ncbi:MAG TPA: flagellar biosynthetic protein FliO [Thermoanaerobacterales bacterium]|nr:flagellar biosynthetic protein FliO [Thermoanaerobacterales bacterium]
MDRLFGSKWHVCLILFILIMAILGNAYAASPDVNNLKTYNFDTPNKQDAQNNYPAKSVFTFFIYFILFLVISLLAFLTTKWIARFQMNAQPKSKYMEVIDVLPLGNNKGIYIIKTPKGLMMVGVSEKNLSIISKLDSDEAELINEVESNTGFMNKNFSNQLEYFLTRLKREPGKKHNGDHS